MRTRTFKEDYADLVRLLPERTSWGWYVGLFAALCVMPWIVPNYITSYGILILIAAVGAIGLNVVTGSAGLISLGYAGFLAIGAYTTGILTTDYGWGIIPSMTVSGIIAALSSVLIGVPSLRLKGLYLAITTLAFSIITSQLILEFDWLTGGSSGKAVARPDLLGIPMRSGTAIYYLALCTCSLVAIASLNLLRSRIGRAWGALRDYDIAASLMGVDVKLYKLLAFAVSSFIIGLAGSLLAFHIRYLNVDSFTLLASIEAIAMIIVGGLASVRGAILGAIVITLLPDVSRYVLQLIGGVAVSPAQVAEVKGLIYGIVIMLFLRLEPEGLVARWGYIKRFWIEWPLSKQAG